MPRKRPQSATEGAPSAAPDGQHAKTQGGAGAPARPAPAPSERERKQREYEAGRLSLELFPDQACVCPDAPPAPGGPPRRENFYAFFRDPSWHPTSAPTIDVAQPAPAEPPAHDRAARRMDWSRSLVAQSIELFQEAGVPLALGDLAPKQVGGTDLEPIFTNEAAGSKVRRMAREPSRVVLAGGAVIDEAQLGGERSRIMLKRRLDGARKGVLRLDGSRAHDHLVRLNRKAIASHQGHKLAGIGSAAYTEPRAAASLDRPIWSAKQISRWEGKWPVLPDRRAAHAQEPNAQAQAVNDVADDDAAHASATAARRASIQQRSSTGDGAGAPAADSRPALTLVASVAGLGPPPALLAHAAAMRARERLAESEGLGAPAELPAAADTAMADAPATAGGGEPAAGEDEQPAEATAPGAALPADGPPAAHTPAEASQPPPPIRPPIGHGAGGAGGELSDVDMLSPSLFSPAGSALTPGSAVDEGFEGFGVEPEGAQSPTRDVVNGLMPYVAGDPYSSFPRPTAPLYDSIMKYPTAPRAAPEPLRAESSAKAAQLSLARATQPKLAPTALLCDETVVDGDDDVQMW